LCSVRWSPDVRDGVLVWPLCEPPTGKGLMTPFAKLLVRERSMQRYAVSNWAVQAFQVVTILGLAPLFSGIIAR
jgi:hypothetical protein